MKSICPLFYSKETTFLCPKRKESAVVTALCDLKPRERFSRQINRFLINRRTTRARSTNFWADLLGL